MNRKNILLIGKVMTIIALIIVFLYSGDQCWIQNEGGRNMRSCGLSIALFVVVLGLSIWSFIRMKKLNV